MYILFDIERYRQYMLRSLVKRCGHFRMISVHVIPIAAIRGNTIDYGIENAGIPDIY